MTATVPGNGHRSSNAFARQRDATILWLLEHHPATAGMLAGIGLFSNRRKAGKRLCRLRQRKQVRILGTVSLKGGHPEQVYCRGRWWKADNLLHEVQLTRVCLKIEADEIRRGQGDTDPFLRPDAELYINGQRFLLEMDCGTMSYGEIVRKRFAKYRACPDFVLWICPSERRRDGLRRHADLIRGTGLFTTLDAALANPHASIWMDVDGEKAALPHRSKGGLQPGSKGGSQPHPLDPPASGVATP